MIVLETKQIQNNHHHHYHHHHSHSVNTNTTIDIPNSILHPARGGKMSRVANKIVFQFDEQKENDHQNENGCHTVMVVDEPLQVKTNQANSVMPIPLDTIITTTPQATQFTIRRDSATNAVCMIANR